MASKQEVAAVLAILSAAYPRFTLTEQTVQTYYALLKDIEVDRLHVAAKRCASTQEFFPTVYELRRAVAEILREAQRLPSAFAAWEETINFPKDGFTSQVIEEEKDGAKFVIEKRRQAWSHPLVELVAKQLGWPQFPGENISTDRAHYFRAYEYALDAALRECVQLPEVRTYIQNLQIEPTSPVIRDGLQKLTGKWSG